MKPRTLLIGLLLVGLLPLLLVVDASAASNRTLRLGQVDTVADSSFISLLESAQADRRTRLSLSRSAEQFTSRSLAETQLVPAVQHASLLSLPALPRQYFDSARLEVAAIPQSDHFESYLMLGLAAGLIALHLRRKQKSLQHRPLAEVMYR